MIVDLYYRDQGIGKKLIQELISSGKEEGRTEIYLLTENEKKQLYIYIPN